jgi:hypothetical protein
MIQQNSGATLLRDAFLRANHGIQLTRCSERGLLARPLTAGGQVDAAAEMLVLPKVPARLLEPASGFLRHVFRTRRTSAVCLLYVHPKQDRWRMYCPPQLCSPREVRIDLSFKDVPAPDPELWLAGSLRSVPPGAADDPAQLPVLLPSHQGVHFVLDLGRPLTHLTAYLRSELGVQPYPVDPLIDDPLDPGLLHLSGRLLFRTRVTTETPSKESH